MVLLIQSPIVCAVKLGPLPSKSRHLDSPWAVARVVGWGQMMEYNQDVGSNKVAISNIVPMQFVDFPEDAKRRFLRRSVRSSWLLGIPTISFD